MSVSRWTVAPTKFVEAVKKDHKTTVVTAALAIDRELVANTPVDTGRAQSNWIPSVSSPSYSVSGPIPLGQLSERAMGVFDPENMPDFPTLYLSNNLPYIVRLNEGWSQQAPAFFVQLSIERVLNEF